MSGVAGVMGASGTCCVSFSDCLVVVVTGGIELRGNGKQLGGNGGAGGAGGAGGSGGSDGDSIDRSNEPILSSITEGC